VNQGLSIGEVLVRLRDDFPDITISKIRFLESEGLVRPARTASGYRKFSEADVDRLRYVLAAQRDHYLPLRVIKEHLAAMDRGLAPPAPASTAPVPPPGADAGTASLRLTRAELLDAAGLDDEVLSQLEGYGLVAPDGEHYDGDALLITRTAAEMAAYGVEARHLRLFRTAADREVGLVEQAVGPLAPQRDRETRARERLAALTVQLHTTLVRAGLRRR
jgi:DNA-binding transcriptional MerR regulator